MPWQLRHDQRFHIELVYLVKTLQCCVLAQF